MPRNLGRQLTGGSVSGVYMQDAACAVCMADDAGAVNVQWGRSRSCSNGHATLYTGRVMAGRHDYKKSEFVCVDPELAAHPQSEDSDHNGNLWSVT